jgi:hypothetical protein
LVVLATGWGATIDAEMVRGRGVVGILAKPYRSADLQRVLTQTAVHPAPDADPHDSR